MAAFIGIVVSAIGIIVAVVKSTIMIMEAMRKMEKRIVGDVAVMIREKITTYDKNAVSKMRTQITRHDKILKSVIKKKSKKNGAKNGNNYKNI
jgi:hypothetical protein